MKKVILTGTMLMAGAAAVLAATACFVSTDLECPGSVPGCTSITSQLYKSITHGTPGIDGYIGDNTPHCEYMCSGTTTYYFVGAYVKGNSCGSGGGTSGTPAPPPS